MATNQFSDHVQIYDDKDLIFGTDSDATVRYDEAGDNRVEFTGSYAFIGDLAIDGGDLTTAATTFNLVNATATTVNIAGAGTTVSIGAATGTATINNATLVAKAISATGAITTTASSMSLAPTSGTATLDVSSAAATFRALRFRTAAVDRWWINANNDTESGSDVGSNLNILSRTDAGAFKTTCLLVNRSSGLFTFGNSIYVTSDCSALTFTDRSPLFEGDALTALKAIKPEAGSKEGDWSHVDHATLPEGVARMTRTAVYKDKATQETLPLAEFDVKRAEIEAALESKGELPIDQKEREEVVTLAVADKYEQVEIDVPGRDIGAMLQVNTKAILQLLERIEALEGAP